MKIVQLLPTMAFGDAVSNDAAAIDRMVRDGSLREGIAAERKARLAQFRYEQVSAKMKECILKLAGGEQ